MKKSFLALAVLSSLAASASAQSSVTLFGVVDAALRVGYGDIANKTQLANSGNNSSRLGFRGVEDLGGGLKAGFHLEAGLNNDDGSGAATNVNNQATGGALAGMNGSQGLTFNRRSYLNLVGGFGELRVGRDYTPQYWSQAIYDPYGNVGIGSSRTASWVNGALGTTGVRASNSIAYMSPAMGGFGVWAMIYSGENASNAAAQVGDGGGLRLTYGKGPFSAAVAFSTTTTGVGTENRTSNIGASYDFGVANVMALYNKEEFTNTPDMTSYSLGASIPMGPGTILASFSSNERNSAKTDQFAVGYVYELSKRTALYGTFASLRNSGGASAAVAGAVTTANGSSNGFDLGIKHSF